MARKLQKERPDMAINLVTTVKGYDYLGATVPSTLELLGIPYTGASILGFAIGCNKHLIYELLSAHGINVPPFQLMTTTTTPLDPTLRFPLILKLNEEHSNVEIMQISGASVSCRQLRI
jgi:D-alanine-D-alanine ligase